MKKIYHRVKNILFKNGRMFLEIDGNKYDFKLSEISPRLVKASKTERERLLISPSGYGIHWPMLDEDLSVDGLLGVRNFQAQRKRVV